MCDALEKYDRFEGKLINTSKFLKRIRKKLEDHKLDEILTLAVSWDEGVKDSRALTKPANVSKN